MIGQAEEENREELSGPLQEVMRAANEQLGSPMVLLGSVGEFDWINLVGSTGTLFDPSEVEARSPSTLMPGSEERDMANEQQQPGNGDVRERVGRLEGVQEQVDKRLEDYRSDMNAGFTRIENAVSAGFSDLKADIRTDKADIRSDIKEQRGWFKWLVGLLIVILLTVISAGVSIFIALMGGG